MNYEDLRDRDHEYAMSYFQRHFTSKIDEIFGKDDVIMAYLFGSIVRGYSSFLPNHKADLDMFVCLEDNTLDKEEKVARFRKWYVEFHIAHGLDPDMEWPGEIMTRSQLDAALGRQPHVKIKLHHNSAATLDTVAWAPMINEPSLEKLGKSADIQRYKDWCVYDSKWINQVLYTLRDEMPPQEMLHRTARFITPWIKSLVKYLEQEVGLVYKESDGYSCSAEVNSDRLLQVLKDFTKNNPIVTINDPKELRKLKKQIIIDQFEGINIKQFAKVLSNPESLLVGNLTGSEDTINSLAKLPLYWRACILRDLKISHPNDIASYTMRGIIDWYHLEDNRVFDIALPREEVLSVQREQLLISNLSAVSDLSSVVLMHNNIGAAIEADVLSQYFSFNADSKESGFQSRLTKDREKTSAVTLSSVISVKLPDLTEEDWGNIKDSKTTIYNPSAHISITCRIAEAVGGRPLEFLSYEERQALTDNVRCNIKEGVLQINLATILSKQTLSEVDLNNIRRGLTDNVTISVSGVQRDSPLRSA